MLPRGALPDNAVVVKPGQYQKNRYGLEDLCRAAYQGDIEMMEMLLNKEDKENGFQGDLNLQLTDMNALMLAAMNGQEEMVEMLLNAGADPHIKTVMPYGKWPEDGKTAKQFAKEWEYPELVARLEKAEKEVPYGVYMKYGPMNNMKLYGYTQEQADWINFGKTNPNDDTITKGEPLPPRPEPKAAYNSGRKARGKPGANAKQKPKPAAVADAPAAAVSAKPKTTIGLMFPGQGSQYVKMLAGVKDIPAVKEMIAKAKDILGWDLEELCLKGPESKLEDTKYCQPCMYVAGLAGLEKLRQDRPEAVESPGCVAGLSLGEYTALAAAGVLSFEDGLKLVKLRGEAMAEAAASSQQAMLSVAGLEGPKLESLCKESSGAASGGVCQIANVLFPKGFSCAGTKAAIDDLKSRAEKAGALQARLLKTSGAFHTPMMSGAQKKLEAALEETLPRMKPNSVDIYVNVTGDKVPAGTAPDKFAKLLSQQLTQSVLWEPSVKAMIKGGMTEFYEVGPMKQLKAMMKRIDPAMWNNTVNVDV
jgi:[acyl-carrier-protein] S-malonyltransferase